MAETEHEDYSTWTACEMYGHKFTTDEDSGQRYCLSCGESYVD